MMKQFSLFCLSIAFICSMACSTCLAKGVKIALRDNTEKFSDIAEIAKITIVDRAVVVNKTSGTSESTPISDILRITLGESSGIDAALSDNAKLTVSPNPCSDVINVSGIADGTMLDLFSIDGSLIFSQPFSNGYQISLLNLTPGVYILKAGNESIKLVKK